MPSLRYHELEPLREKRWLGTQGTTESLLRTDGAQGLIPAPLQAQRNTTSVSFKKQKQKNLFYLLLQIYQNTFIYLTDTANSLSHNFRKALNFFLKY